MIEAQRREEVSHIYLLPFRERTTAINTKIKSLQERGFMICDLLLPRDVAYGTPRSVGEILLQKLPDLHAASYVLPPRTQYL
jgi:hypothetical protein